MMRAPGEDVDSLPPQLKLLLAKASTATTMPSSPTSNPGVDMSATRREWNTKKLGLRLGVDLLSALAAGSLVAPLIAIIDRSIMENASGRRRLVQSLKSSITDLLVRPQTLLFSKPLALIFMVYGGTYLTANTLDTATSTVANKACDTVSAGTAKFVAGSCANTGLTIYKDHVFVRLFGPTGVPARPVPLPSYLLFALRDSMTIFASFNLPPLLGPWLSERMGAEMRDRLSGQTLAQFAAPAAVQAVSTPIHLLGLELYNRPAALGIGWRDRWAAVRKNWLVSSAARMCRIVPAFGIGGVVNAKVRRLLMERLA